MEENQGIWTAIIAAASGVFSIVAKGYWDSYKTKTNNQANLEIAKIDDWKNRYMELDKAYNQYRAEAAEREYSYQEKQKGLQDQISTLRSALDKATRFMGLSLKLLKTTTDPKDAAILAVIEEMDKIYDDGDRQG